ncbi:hypothetical protein WN51_01591 [Melipona quadrifasciata]|uniref:Uncharacterized protein n=1 Tax=Melipona quadrifasciata TaxID=166423 RepID=A0A0N0BE31_9HYME|nr:hypothetical protein WN51_01591 [Melipona quadrifasciata]
MTVICRFSITIFQFLNYSGQLDDHVPELSSFLVSRDSSHDGHQRATIYSSL